LISVSHAFFFQHEFESEREELVDTIRELDRQLKLKDMVVRCFVPSAYVEIMEQYASYDEFNDDWNIPGMEIAGL